MSHSSSNLEVEVKFLLPDLASFRQRLLAEGATISKARVFERNIRFDTADDRLFHRQELLRLRQDTAVKITFKGPPIESPQSEAKVRQELEITANDFQIAHQLIEQLGYMPKQVYEKYRETFHLSVDETEIEVVLDELPFGHFVELEGDEAAIKAGAKKLSLNWEERILQNYLGFMAQLKAHHNLSFDDLSFANFEGLSVSVKDIL